ncbi:NAD(P)-dependent oxidoreductase [Spelaeicoccus albus]|uniref:3-hydroxyisobutyrate dehydrogenase-like beta-hydroxyacid dehydrogenase n=1 Tax=Spelaeicoccus albus TaxID=1280376 RepID=A0A7Z0ABE6_9MICO|nr:NAD(P)-dependent oxidoreductase [Spelaeicoccus albus]NYI67098.1 3-hydroxyisobutyrate dehydrogenase-like beta-hydroxyacid dehydrogenase [Spelaeicoccus albus]
MSKTAIIGLGTMGGRVAAKLAAAGRDVAGFDLSEEAMTAAAEAGVKTSADRDSIVADAELIVLSLPRPAHVVQAAESGLTTAKPGSLVVDLSTIDPGSAKKAAELLANQSVKYVDAPVLGRPEGCGNWTLAAGGTTTSVDIAAKELEGVVARKMARVGDVGAGSVVKILNNLMFGAINAVTAEALNTCRLAGVDPETFTNTVAESGAATVSNLFRELGPKLNNDDYEPAFSLALLAKDNKLAVDLEREVGAASFVAACVDQVNALTIDQGHASRDTGVVQELYRHVSRAATA